MNRICALATPLYDGNLRWLSGASGTVHVGMMATRHRSTLVRECKDRARDLGESVTFLAEMWPQTVAQAEDPTGQDLYRWIAYLTRIGDNYLRTRDGEIVMTDWRRAFPWIDMRTDAPPATAGPFSGLRPFEWIVDAIAQWWAVHGNGAYDGFLWDGWVLEFAHAWLGGQALRMPDGWIDTWREGSIDALARIRAIAAPCVCALDDRFFPEVAATDGGLIEDFGFRRSLFADLYGEDRYSLRMADADYRKRTPRPPIIVKLNTSTTMAQLPALVAAASMYDNVYLSWYRPGLTGHETVLNQLDAIERLQPYREMPTGPAAQLSEWSMKPEQLRAKRPLDDGRTIRLGLPSREVSGL